MVSLSGQGCGRRVAVLYSGGILGCQQCHQLGYECQRERPHDRTTERRAAPKGGSGAVADGLPPKLTGMRSKTYARLASTFEREEGQ
jgi:hypothetical protein